MSANATNLSKLPSTVASNAPFHNTCPIESLPFNAWPIFVAGLVAGTVPVIGDAAAAERFFYASLKYNFYAIFAVASTLLFSLGVLPGVSPIMRRARERALRDGDG